MKPYVAVVVSLTLAATLQSSGTVFAFAPGPRSVGVGQRSRRAANTRASATFMLRSPDEVIGVDEDAASDATNREDRPHDQPRPSHAAASLLATAPPAEGGENDGELAGAQELLDREMLAQWESSALKQWNAVPENERRGFDWEMEKLRRSLEHVPPWLLGPKVRFGSGSGRAVPPPASPPSSLRHRLFADSSSRRTSACRGSRRRRSSRARPTRRRRRLLLSSPRRRALLSRLIRTRVRAVAPRRPLRHSLIFVFILFFGRPLTLARSIACGGTNTEFWRGLVVGAQTEKRDPKSVYSSFAGSTYPGSKTGALDAFRIIFNNLLQVGSGAVFPRSRCKIV